MVDCGENSNRFVCPNDRQLALRAKLKTGWSIKTGSIGYQNSSGRTNNSLDADEQAAILEVIHRAEQLELREQERVGRLVDRLENMRRNALGRSASQCLLCGDRFGLLGAQSVPCVACGKLVCQKCAIEACLSPRATRNERIAQMHQIQQQQAQKRQQPQQQQPRQSHRQLGRDQWLCKICAETREIWKKSGAWFFKGLPKYILPGQEPKRSLGGISPPAGNKDEDSSSEEEKRGFLSSSRRHSYSDNNTSPYQDSHPLHQQSNDPSPSHFPGQLCQPGQYSRQTSSTESQRSISTTSVTFLGPNVGLNTDGAPPERWDEENPLVNTSVYLGDMFRRDSAASRSMSEWTWNEEKTSPGAGSVSPNTGFKQATHEDQTSPKHLDPTTSTIELTLSYDSIRDTLHCTVHRAKNLQPMDINGLADPFCKLNIIPEGKLCTRLRTRTVHKTRNPEFNEALTFYEISPTDLLKKQMHVLVLDDDKYGHDYMGETKVTLAALRVQKSISVTVALERTLPDDCSLGPDTNLPPWFEDPWSRGQILISLCYSTKKRALLVTVVRCANLLPMDNNGFSDPFVKLHLKPDPHHRKHKTTIKWKNLNPFYNEEFPFETRPNELSTQSLYITVWDKDYGKSNDYLGGLILGGAGSKGRRLKHWLDMIRYPDHRHEYWHSLTEDTLSD